MLTDNRKYNFIGELTLKRSCIFQSDARPKDDKVNWLFLIVEEQQFSFVYKIENPLEANYDEPFMVNLAFTMIETVIAKIGLNYEYKILRGQENIGNLKIITAIE